MIKESIRIILQCFNDISPTEVIANNNEDETIFAYVIMVFGKKNKYRYFYSYCEPDNIISRIREMLISKQNSSNTILGPLHLSERFDSIDNAIKGISNNNFLRETRVEFKSFTDMQKYVNKAKRLGIIT